MAKLVNPCKSAEVLWTSYGFPPPLRLPRHGLVRAAVGSLALAPVVQPDALGVHERPRVLLVLASVFFSMFSGRVRRLSRTFNGATWPILGHREAGEAQRSLQLPLRDRKGDLGPYSKSSKE